MLNYLTYLGTLGTDVIARTWLVLLANRITDFNESFSLTQCNSRAGYLLRFVCGASSVMLCTIVVGMFLSSHYHRVGIDGIMFVNLLSYCVSGILRRLISSPALLLCSTFSSVMLGQSVALIVSPFQSVAISLNTHQVHACRLQLPLSISLSSSTASSFQ